MSARANRGFTLVELLVVVVLGALLVAAVSQVLITNSRIFTVNNAQIQGQQIMRAGVDVLFGELREISIPGEDLVVMDTDQLGIRSQRAFGLVCDTDYSVSPETLTVVRVGSGFRAGDSITLYADNDPEGIDDDVWLAKAIGSVSPTANCGGREAQILTIPDLASTGDTVRVGAPVRAFDRFTYGSFVIDGETYLGRQARGASEPDPLVGPILPSGGVVFRYLDAREQVTTVSTEVLQIEVTLRYESEARRVSGQRVSDSIVTRIHPRN
jgi:prepilin-type N-terminal cleavage/methylation domain-containing protein